MQPPEQNFAFVLGIPRSGTTLLSVLLGRHPAVLARGEPWLMLALQSLGTTHPAHPADAELIRLATADFLGAAAPRRLGAAARAIYGDVLADEGKSWFVDKTPRYHLCLDLLAEAFPAAKFFWMVRNPLDAAASFCDTWKFDLADLIERTQDHFALIDFMFGLPALIDHAAGHDVCVVRYEALAVDPEREIGRAFAHLSLDPPRGATRFGKLKRAGRFGDPKIHRTTAVHDRSIGSHRRIFSPRQLRTIAGGLGRELMDTMGYGDTFDEIAALGPIVDRSAELRGAASAMVAARRRAAAEGALQKDGSPPAATADGASAAIEADLAAMREQADRLGAANRDLARSAVRDARQRDALEADRSARGAVIDDLQLRLAAAERERAAHQERSEALERQAAGLGGELAESRREAAARLGLIGQLDGARSGMEALLARERADAERQVAELNADRAARGDVIEDLQARLRHVEAERTTLEALINGIERDREARLKVINRMSMQLRAAEEDSRVERKVRNDLEGGIAMLNAIAVERLAAIERLTTDLAGAQEDRASRLAVIDGLEAARAALTTALADQAGAAAKEIKALNDDRAARGAIIETLTARVAALETDQAASGSAIRAIERDREARLKTIGGLVAQLKSAEAERFAELALRNELTARIDLLATAAADRLDSIERLTGQLEAAQRDRAERLAVIEELGQNAAEMAERIGQIGAESAARLAVIEELDSARSTLVANIASERAAAARQIAELNEDRAARGAVIAALRTDLDDARAERRARATELAAIERDREARLEVIDRLTLSLKAAEADRLDGVAVRESLQEQVAQLSTAAAERLALIERVTSDLAAVEADRMARGELVESLDRIRQERDASIVALERERQADRAGADLRQAQLEQRLSELGEANEALGRQWSPRLKAMLTRRR